MAQDHPELSSDETIRRLIRPESDEASGVTHYSHRHLMKQLIFNQMRRNRNILLVSAIVLAVFEPLLMLLRSMTDQANLFSESITFGMLLVVPSNLILTVILMMRIFGFIHHAEAGYFFFSLPIPRGTLYRSYVTTVLISLLIVNVPRAILAWLLLLRRYGMSYELSTRMAMDGKMFVVLCAVVSMLLLFMLLTGSRFDFIAFTFLFSIVWPIAIILINLTARSYLPGFTMQSAYFLGSNRWTAVPYMFMLVPTVHIILYPMLELSAIFYWAAYSLLIFLADYIIFMGRRAEYSGLRLAQTLPYRIIRLVTGISVGLVAGWGFLEISDPSLSWLLPLGTFIGASLAHIIADMTFKREERSWGATFKGMIPTLAILGIVFLILQHGAFGFSVRNTDGDTLSSVVVFDDEDQIDADWTHSAKVKEPELMHVLQDIHTEYTHKVRDAIRSSAGPKPYTPMFGGSVPGVYYGPDDESSELFTIGGGTMILQRENGTSLYRDFAWGLRYSEENVALMKRDPAFALWAGGMGEEPEVMYDDLSGTKLLSAFERSDRVRKLRNAYLQDLNALDWEERLALGRETPEALLTFYPPRMESLIPAPIDPAEASYWSQTVYRYDVIDTETQERTPYNPSLEPQDRMYPRELLRIFIFRAPVSERTPRTQRMLKNLMD